jgi:transcriptional regulator with XRE-family HTH domain
MLKARAKVGLTQDAVAARMGTTKSALTKLEAPGKHNPSLATLKRYAEAVGWELEMRFVPHRTG